jgi:UDPglucose 6-dehydrogenase
MQKTELIGFIGQGWIGKHYADDFERRGYKVVRYSMEKPYVANKSKIEGCDIVFIAVPTPTTPEGFDDSIIRSVIKLVGKGKTAVIKSTLLPGTTDSIQKENPGIFVLNSPEFLSVSTAAYDASNPSRNIVGIPVDDPEYRKRAEAVIRILPRALYKLTYNCICSSREAELIKYGRNYLGYVRVVAINLFYDLVSKLDVDWDVIRDAMSADPDNGPTYMNPLHKSGRGAGGECFIKDFAAFREMYEKMIPDVAGLGLLKALEQKNIDLLLGSKKDLELLKGVYGSKITDTHPKSR